MRRKTKSGFLACVIFISICSLSFYMLKDLYIFEKKKILKIYIPSKYLEPLSKRLSSISFGSLEKNDLKAIAAFNLNLAAVSTGLEVIDYLTESRQNNFTVNNSSSGLTCNNYSCKYVAPVFFDEEKEDFWIFNLFLKNTFKKTKNIYLEVAYPNENSNENFDYEMYLFVKCIQVTKLLNDNGWNISAFVTNPVPQFWSNYPWITVEVTESPINFANYLDFIKEHTFAFVLGSNRTIYEALQCGIPTIIFKEMNVPQLFLKNDYVIICDFNGNPTFCADKVLNFHANWDEEKFHDLQQEAEDLSPETFLLNLRANLE